MRREAFGEDIGQNSWITASEWLSFADRLRVGPSSEVLEIGSGSGGPAVYLADTRRCRLTGIDINKAGFSVLDVDDVTKNAASVARRWHNARARHREQLVAREGQANFDGVQRFLWCVHVVSDEHRLSRFAYLAARA